MSVCDSAAHARRSHPASAVADVNQRLARGAAILVTPSRCGAVGALQADVIARIVGVSCVSAY